MTRKHNNTGKLVSMLIVTVLSPVSIIVCLLAPDWTTTALSALFWVGVAVYTVTSIYKPKHNKLLG